MSPGVCCPQQRLAWRLAVTARPKRPGSLIVDDGEPLQCDCGWRKLGIAHLPGSALVATAKELLPVKRPPDDAVSAIEKRRRHSMRTDPCGTVVERAVRDSRQPLNAQA
jgi:hypothetical protein